MKFVKLIAIFIVAFSYGYAQKKAVTETGEEVILYEDGTWEYSDDSGIEETVIPVNPKIFQKGPESTFLLKSKNFNIGFWLDPKEWTFKKGGEDNADAEYSVRYKSGDLYAMIITEKIPIPLEALKEIALVNAKKAAPDIRVIKEEYRNVNGITVLFLNMEGTITGIKFSYYGYYYSNENGTAQFITLTAQKLMNEYKDECEKLLNGIVEVK